MMVRLLYVPQFLHTLCGITSSPHVEHFARFGTLIFQFALLLSLLAFEVLFFGQILISYTSLNIQIRPQRPYLGIILTGTRFVNDIFPIISGPDARYHGRSSVPHLSEQQEPSLRNHRSRSHAQHRGICSVLHRSLHPCM